MSSKQEEEVKSVPNDTNDNGDDDDYDDLRTKTTYQLFLEIQRLAMLHHSVNEHASTPVVNDAFCSALKTIQNRVSDIAAEIERRRFEKRRLVIDAEKKRKLEEMEKKQTKKKQKSMIPDD